MADESFMAVTCPVCTKLVAVRQPTKESGLCKVLGTLEDVSSWEGFTEDAGLLRVIIDHPQHPIASGGLCRGSGILVSLIELRLVCSEDANA